MKRLTRLEVENFKKIVFLDIPISGVTEISGPNGAGKSSTLDALWVLFKGMKVAPVEPIRKGAERARIRGRIGEMYVCRTIERKKGGEFTSKITLEPADGGPYPATQKQLDDLIGEHMLDPLDFVRKDAKGKFEILRAFVPGFNFEKAANESRADYARRTECNRMAEESRAAASLILVPEGTTTEPIDEQALVDELQRAGETNAEIERRRSNRERAADEITQLRQSAETSLAQVEPDLAALNAVREQRIAALEAQIAELNRMIEGVKLQYLVDHDAVKKKRADEAETATRRAEELQAKLDTADPLPKPIDTVALAAKIQEARTNNGAAERAVEKHKHTTTAVKYEAESQNLTDRMKAREAAKQKAISEAKLPIDGIGFGDGEILLHGVPIEQASSAQKLTAGVAIAVAAKPELRLVWIRDASLLDDDMKRRVDELAAEFECTIMLETVRPIGKDAIVLEDGRVKDAAAKADNERAA